MCIGLGSFTEPQTVQGCANMVERGRGAAPASLPLTMSASSAPQSGWRCTQLPHHDGVIAEGAELLQNYSI